MRMTIQWIKQILKWIYCFIEAIIALVFILLGIGFWHLYTQPMTADFLLPEVSSRLLPEDSGYKLEVTSSLLFAEPNRRGILHLNIQQLKVLRSDNTVVLSLPEVNLSYGLWNILTLDYMPDSLEILQPYLRLIINEKGQLLFQDGVIKDKKASAEKIESPALRKIVNHIFSLETLHIVDGRIHVDDLMLNQELSVPKFSLLLDRDFGFMHKANAHAVVRVQDELVDIQAKGSLSRITKQLKLGVGIPLLKPENLGRFIPILKGIEFPVSILVSGDFDLRLSRKNLSDCLEKMKFQIKSLSPGLLKLPDPIENIYAVNQIEINGGASDGFKVVKIAKSSALLQNGITADLTVSVSGVDTFFHTWNLSDVKTTLESTVKDVAMSDVPKVWPSEQGPDAHEWVETHLSKGKIKTADFRLDFVGGELVDLFGDVRAQGVNVDYLPPMMPVKEVSAQVLLYPNEVKIIADAAQKTVRFLDLT